MTGRLIALVALAVLALAPIDGVPAQTIDTIVVDNRNVFDHTDDAPSFVARLANKLHVKTHASVIRRTLLLAAGDPYDSARVVESELALRNLLVFRDVHVDTARVGGRLALRARTADGWSTRPQATYSSAGGDETWAVGFVEQNFLGTATTIAAFYKKNPDRRLLELQYGAPAFLWRRAELGGRYQDLSDGRTGLWAYGVPFYETSAPWALATDGEAATQRVLRFRDGVLADSAERRALRFGVSGGVALRASSRSYLRVRLSAQWRREDYDPIAATTVPYSQTAAAGATIEVGHRRIHVLEGVNTYARREGFDLSQTLSLGAWAAPRAWGYGAGEAGIGPAVRGQVSAVWHGGFVVMRVAAQGVVGVSRDSGRVEGELTAVSQRLSRQTLVVHVEGGAIRGAKLGSEFDLWQDADGPRTFGAHAFTGTRRVWVAVEDRVLVARNLWGLVGVGVAPFLDWGGAWYADEGARVAGNAGVALRLGPTRAVRGDVAEFALGYRFGDLVTGNRWGFVVRQAVAFK